MAIGVGFSSFMEDLEADRETMDMSFSLIGGSDVEEYAQYKSEKYDESVSPLNVKT